MILDMHNSRDKWWEIALNRLVLQENIKILQKIFAFILTNSERLCIIRIGNNAAQ